MRFSKIMCEDGTVIVLTPEEEVDILTAFAFSMFKQLIYDRFPPPPGSPVDTPEKGFAMQLGTFAHYYITNIKDKRNESFRH